MKTTRPTFFRADTRDGSCDSDRSFQRVFFMKNRHIKAPRKVWTDNSCQASLRSQSLMLPVVDTYVQRHQPLQFPQKIQRFHAEIWSRWTLGSQSAGTPWSHVKRKIEVLRGVCGLILITRLGRNGEMAQGSGGKAAFEKHQKKGWTTKIQQTKISKSNLKIFNQQVQMSPQISPANLFISGWASW